MVSMHKHKLKILIIFNHLSTRLLRFPVCLLVFQVFEGNHHTDIAVLALFNSSSTVARYIRINPQTWYQNGTQGDICLRAEVLGCVVPGTRGQLLETVFIIYLHYVWPL